MPARSHRAGSHSAPRTPSPRPRRARLALCALPVLLAAGACSRGLPVPSEAPLAGAAIGGPFTLEDKDGKPVRYADFDGRYRVLYFGYSFCPDVCPLDLSHLMQGVHAFAREHPELGGKVQPIFVTVDPARDTPAKVGEYAANFGPELLGLTGTPAQIAAAAREWAVFYQKRKGETPKTYLMDHSRAAYLMGPKGEPIALLPADQTGKAVADELAKWVR